MDLYGGSCQDARFKTSIIASDRVNDHGSSVEWSTVNWNALGIATHQHFLEVTSTNDVARETAGSLTEDSFPLLITCERQTRGRGRNGRQWWHGQGGLACSIVLPLPSQVDEDPLAPRHAPQRLAIWTAVCLQETAARFLTNQVCQIKWPNDLMIADRKNAGILIEPVPLDGRTPSIASNLNRDALGPARLVVVGIGVNINNTDVENSEFASTDWFSWSETRQRFAVPRVLADFLARWLPRSPDWPPPMSLLQSRFVAVDWLRGKRLEIQAMGAWTVLPNGDLRVADLDQQTDLPVTLFGNYAGIDERGFLRLRSDNGDLWVFPSVQRVHALS